MTPSMQDLRSKTGLRVQCPSSFGIDLPQLLEGRVYSLRQAFDSVFQHRVEFSTLFEDERKIGGGELLHLISASLHRTNFISIEQEIKDISFQELRNPDMRTNAKLLTLREVLYELATETAETSKCVPDHVKQFYMDFIQRGKGVRLVNSKFGDQSRVERLAAVNSPIERLAAINEQASDLQRFLMDSFQLLMSSVSLAETQNAAKQAKLSMEQAVRTAKLTQLAFIYIPLTFVTSVFGMNLRELSDPVPPVWVCAVTLVVVAAATAAIFGSYKYKPVNLMSNLLGERYARRLGLRRTAVPSQGTGAMVTDEEKGPTRPGAY
jgi:Mg2+ and Co2+ transporter CorA